MNVSLTELPTNQWGYVLKILTHLRVKQFHIFQNGKTNGTIFPLQAALFVLPKLTRKMVISSNLKTAQFQHSARKKISQRRKEARHKKDCHISSNKLSLSLPCHTDTRKQVQQRSLYQLKEQNRGARIIYPQIKFNVPYWYNKNIQKISSRKVTSYLQTYFHSAVQHLLKKTFIFRLKRLITD